MKKLVKEEIYAGPSEKSFCVSFLEIIILFLSQKTRKKLFCFFNKILFKIIKFIKIIKVFDE